MVVNILSRKTKKERERDLNEKMSMYREISLLKHINIFLSNIFLKSYGLVNLKQFSIPINL